MSGSIMGQKATACLPQTIHLHSDAFMLLACPFFNIIMNFASNKEHISTSVAPPIIALAQEATGVVIWTKLFVD